MASPLRLLVSMSQCALCVVDVTRFCRRAHVQCVGRYMKEQYVAIRARFAIATTAVIAVVFVMYVYFAASGTSHGFFVPAPGVWSAMPAQIASDLMLEHFILISSL